MQNIQGASVATLILALTIQLGFGQMPALNLPHAATAGSPPAQSLFPPDDTIQRILDERVAQKRAFGIALATRGAKGKTRIDHAGPSGQDGEKEKPPSPLAAERLRTEAKLAVVVARLEKRLPELMKEGEVPGLAIALLRDGELVWQRGFGVKNSKTKDPVDDTTVFEAASLGKPLFAYGVLKLVDAGKFDLDKPLDKYLASNSADGNASKVTARHVLSHTAGFSHGGGTELRIHFTPGERFS